MDAVRSGFQRAIEKMGTSKASEKLDKIACDEDNTNVEAIRVSNVHENLSSIQRILMDESNEISSDRALFMDAVRSGFQRAIEKMGTSKASEKLDKIACDEDNTNVEAIRVSNVHEDLSSIQRILMDESDDADMLQLLDKDVNLDLAFDFGSILDMDRPCDKSSTMESIENEKLTAVYETERNDVEANKSTSEHIVGISPAQKSVDTIMSSSPEFVNQKVECLKDARTTDAKLCEQNVPWELSEIVGLTSTGRESEKVGEFSLGKFDENLERRKRLVVCGLKAKGKKTKVKKAKKMSEKIVESGKHTLSYVEGEAFNSMSSGGDDLMVHGKAVKQNAVALSRCPSTKELLQDKDSWPKGRERLQYTREQLLNLGKTAFIPEHIKKVAREIGVEIHEKHQISAAFKVADSSFLKKKRGGSLSEAKKEKKKMKKRKKRAELNRQLGVKRLKLLPNVKPKVVQHCRHYLMGRCYEGEKCKFSHDVVPLTKSKPCCHFARQACMKGDECPFDHELSKYPCNSFADTGFCSRGESCLFSHKISVKAASEPSSVPLKCDSSSADQRDLSKSKHQANTVVPSTSGKATPKNLKMMLATETIKPAKKPRGLSFFSFGTSQLEDSVQSKESDMHQQSKSSAVVAEATSDSRKTPLNIPGSVAQGINYPFLGNTPIGNSSGTSLLNDSSKYQPKRTSGRSDGTVGTLTPNEAFNVSESLPTPTPSPERDPNFSAMYSGTSTLNLSEILKSFPITTPTPERALNVSEISKGPTPIPERALNLSKFLKVTPTPTPTPAPELIRSTPTATPIVAATPSSTTERALNLSDLIKSSPTQIPTSTPTTERALNLSDLLKSSQTPIPTATATTGRALNLSEMLKGALTQAKAKGISVSSSDISHGKSTSVFSTEQEKGNINASEKMTKEVQPEPGRCGAQSSSSRFSSKIDLQVKKPPNNTQKALQSALAFASKYESGIKLSSTAATKDNNLNDGTSCSGFRQSEPSQASKILQFLNRQGGNEKK
ncbi:hypothetical protein RND81_08G024000 [Saponaria officinalis]